MRRVMIRCQSTGTAVPTDFMSSPDVFAELRFAQMRLVCPACGEVHVWGREDAFLEDRVIQVPAAGTSDCTSDYRIDEELGIVVSRLSGRCTMDDMVGFRRRLYADPAYRTDMPLLIDARGLTQVLPLREVRELAADLQRSPHAGSGRRAIVTNSDVVSDRIRMFSSFAGDALEYRVFTDVVSALAWLTDHVGDADPDATAAPDRPDGTA
jgi:hypothetical protein